MLGNLLGGAHPQSGLLNQAAQQHSTAGQSYQNQGLIQQQNQLMQAYQAAQAQKAVFDPNTVEAFQVPLSTVVNVWRAKFGDVWVEGHLIKEPFFASAYVRLMNNQMFENAGSGYVRLKEGV